LDNVPIVEIATPHGLARAHLDFAKTEADEAVADPVGALALGHGAGGGVQAPDLAAAARAGRRAGFTVALVEQPYRVAGRRTPAPARQLDEAWLAVLEHLRAGPWAKLPLVVGGRSSGARVACRTATTAEAAGVLCLAFPVHPPGRAGDPAKSRLAELDAVTVPTLVVQGDKDPFGMPPPGGRRAVVAVAGNHALRAAGAVEAAVGRWLAELRL
jgi:predicted alpha/beta-hydrolase family hydrolase